MLEQIAGNQLGQMQELQHMIQDGIKNSKTGGIGQTDGIGKSGAVDFVHKTQATEAPSFSDVMTKVNTSVDSQIKAKDNAVLKAMTGPGDSASIHRAAMQMKETSLMLTFTTQVYKLGTHGIQELMRMQA